MYQSVPQSARLYGQWQRQGRACVWSDISSNDADAMHALLRCAALLMLIAASLPARAATVCVNSAVGLIQAINSFDAQPDGSLYTIKIVQGTYNVDNAMGFHNVLNNVGIRLLGGYTAGCTGRTINPTNTVLDARNMGGSDVGLLIYGNTEAVVEGLTFTRFRGASVLTLFQLEFGEDQSRLEVRHCRFVNNVVSDSVIDFAGSRMQVSNSLIAGNTLTNSGATAVMVDYNIDADSAAIVNNNTIANNSGGAGLTITSANGSYRLGEATNNIVYGHTIDLNLAGFFYPDNSLSVRNNLYGTLLGIPLTADNIVANPLFANAAAGDYSLALISPAINSGAATQYYSFPAKDLANTTRIIGSRIDRGAYESPQDDLNGFIVSTTADNGSNSSPSPGSLRAAIKAGNAAGNPYTIRFALSGSCPRIINITTALPDITGEVTIDGSSQSGWLANSSYGRFDATLCLVLNGSGSVPWAFHVPNGANNAHLTVKGMMLAGYTDAAIKLEGGHDHHVLGNQIGAIAFTSDSDKGVYVGGSASGTYIGGFDDPSAVNLIAGTQTAGVYLENASGGSVVANNVIGFLPDGAGAVGNALGIYLFNSPSNLISYNYVGNSASAGIQLSGTGSRLNTLQYNVIGVNAAGVPAGNTGAGVALSFGARENTIGAPQTGSYGTNIISRNSGPGVWVTPSGGAGNRVLSGYFDQNGGLAIDLDASGPSTNPANPGSTGPNLRQAYPVLTQAVRSTGPTSDTVLGTLTASLSNSSYRIDFYRASSCGSNGRGVGGNAIGRVQVLTNAAGVASINVALGLPTGSSLGGISATATDPNGNTSELGNCVIETIGVPPVLFANGFE